MKFARIEMLFFIWSIPLLLLIILYGLRRRKSILRQYASEKRRIVFNADVKPEKRLLKWGLVLTGILFSVISLAGPQYGYHWQKVEQKGIDIIIALDCSKSMLANDISPTRLDRAKREVVDLLSMLKGDRVGLVAFAGTAFLQCPLTVDYEAFYLFLDALSPGYLPVGGTDLEAVVTTAISAFNKEERSEKAVILITDGENTGNDLSPALEAAKKAGIKIFTIGVGNEAGVPVPNESGGLIKDADGNIVVTRLNEDLLEQMAQATGGIYVKSEAGDMDLETVYEMEIRGKMDATPLASGKKQVWEDRFQWFLIAAVAAFIAESFIPVNSGKRTAKLLGILLLIMIGSPSPGFADSTAGAVRKGNEAYEKGDYPAALKFFIDAQLKEPDNPDIYYNIGNSQYKLEEYDAAVKSYRQAIKSKDSSLQQKARYNMGNAMVRLKRLKEAVSEYESALKIDSEDREAKENLEFVKKMMEAQKQQQQNTDDTDNPSDKREESASDQSGENQDDRKGPSDSPDEKKDSHKSEENGSRPEEQKNADSGSNPSESGQFGKEMEDPGNRPESNAAEKPEQQNRRDAGSEDKTMQSSRKLDSSSADRMLNRLKDTPGKALIPATMPREVEKDW